LPLSSRGPSPPLCFCVEKLWPKHQGGRNCKQFLTIFDDQLRQGRRLRSMDASTDGSREFQVVTIMIWPSAAPWIPSECLRFPILALTIPDHSAHRHACQAQGTVAFPAATRTCTTLTHLHIFRVQGLGCRRATQRLFRPSVGVARSPHGTPSTRSAPTGRSNPCTQGVTLCTTCTCTPAPTSQHRPTSRPSPCLVSCTGWCGAAGHCVAAAAAAAAAAMAAAACGQAKGRRERASPAGRSRRWGSPGRGSPRRRRCPRRRRRRCARTPRPLARAAAARSAIPRRSKIRVALSHGMAWSGTRATAG
jgi:hypothetical protein